MANYDPSVLTQTVAGIIRGRMARFGIGQAELAAAINVSQSQLSKMVRGIRPIDIDQLDGMAVALGLDAWSVLREAEEAVADWDPDYNTAAVFVEGEARREEPFRPRTRWNRDVGGAAQDDDLDNLTYLTREEVEADLADGRIAADRRPRKADREPFAE